MAIAARIAASTPSTLKNPLQLRSAVEMALLFQVVLFAVYYMREWIGDQGLLASGFVLGLTDVDALTLSMTRSVVDRHDDRERPAARSRSASSPTR